MEKDNQLNKNSMDYIPTWDEMKLPQKLRSKLEAYIEDESEAEKVEKEYQGYIDSWQRRHREKIRKVEVAKAEIKNRKILSHWFSTLPQDQIIQLIDRSRSVCDFVMDDIRDGAKASWQLNYIEKLRIRVKRNPIEITDASMDKLKRFPRYNAASDKLTGSPYAFYRMWAHIFKSERMAKRSVSI